MADSTTTRSEKTLEGAEPAMGEGERLSTHRSEGWAFRSPEAKTPGGDRPNYPVVRSRAIVGDRGKGPDDGSGLLLQRLDGSGP